MCEMVPAGRARQNLSGLMSNHVPLQAFKGIKGLLMSTVFTYTNSKGENPFWPGIQYAGACQAQSP